jgi:hypothetical protein
MAGAATKVVTRMDAKKSFMKYLPFGSLASPPGHS